MNKKILISVCIIFFATFIVGFSKVRASFGDPCSVNNCNCPLSGSYPCPTSPPTCFLPGTKVETPDGEKNIEDIQVGDGVTSFNGLDEVVDSSVTSIYRSQRDFYFDLKADDYEVKASAEHPFYMGNGEFKEIQYLMAGDEIFILNKDKVLEKKTVTSNMRIDEKTDVYNMTVDKTHTYFANSFAVHNKGSGTDWCDGSGYSTCAPLEGYPRHVPYPACKCCSAGQVVNATTTYWTAPTTEGGDTACGGGNLRLATNTLYSYPVCVPTWDGHCDDAIVWVYQHFCQGYACQNPCTPVAPAAPGLLSPPDGHTTSNPSVILQWNAVSVWGTKCPPPNVNTYRVYVGTTNPPTTLYTTGVSTSVIFVGTPGTTYYWGIETSNGGQTSNSLVRSFTIQNNQISGRVYLDTNNTCSTATPWTTGGVSISVDGGAGNAITGTGTYTVTATTGVPHTVAVSIPSGYVCSTGAGCNSCTKTGIIPGTANASNNNFFLSNVREAWWQTEGAGIYAGGAGSTLTTVRSELPSSSYRLILAGGAGTPAALLRGSGSTDLGSGSVSDSLWTTTAKYKGKKMDYAYFAAQMGVLPAQANDWGADTMNKPGTTKDFHYIDPQSGTATVSSPWAVASGEKYVVFVNGDLRVSANTTVDDGGFLAYIVSGDIIVDPAVTTMQGVYIASSNFETESVDTTDTIADVQLNVAGNVISWGTFSLGRSLIGSNINTPAEKFTYRPDLLENMPDKMKTFAMNWQEVAPGTFGE